MLAAISIDASLMMTGAVPERDFLCIVRRCVRHTNAAFRRHVLVILVTIDAASLTTATNRQAGSVPGHIPR